MMHKKHNIDLNSMINKPKNPISCRETLWQKECAFVKQRDRREQ